MLLLLLAIAAILGVGGVLTLLEAARIEAAHPASGRFIEVEGGRLHVLELTPSGAEEQSPIVLVHGASGNLNDLRLALGDRLAANRRVILVDRPGHGWSDRPGGIEDASPGRQAALIMAALDRMNVERFVLLGHSLGGAVASALALAWPERVTGLVLLAPVTHPWEGSSISWYNVLLSTPVVGRLFAHTVALPLSFLLLGGGVASVFSPQSAPEDYVRRAAIRLLLRPAQFVANAQDLAALKAFVTAQVPRYAEIGMPTVIVTGSADGTVSPQLHAHAFAAAVPRARLVMLAGIGHMPHHVEPDQVVAAVEQLAAQPVTHLPVLMFGEKEQAAASGDTRSSRTHQVDVTGD
jgi:pimeloyl-ACP methyl ester carboxylesterase